ncbi:MAG: hypothetical protein ACRDNZ_05325 [Streptosporangiaceae bacterium]
MITERITDKITTRELALAGSAEFVIARSPAPGRSRRALVWLTRLSPAATLRRWRSGTVASRW